MSLKYLLLLAVIFPSWSQAKPYGASVNLSPFAGSANTSTNETVENNSGVKISVDKAFPVISKFSLGPRIEASNSFTNTKGSKNNRTQLSTYDIRAFGFGLISTYEVFSSKPQKQLVYLASTIGRNYAKINQDESGEDYYVEKNFHNIKGYYNDTEVGMNFLVKPTLGFNIGAYYHTNYLNLSGVSATTNGEKLSPEGGLSLAGDAEEEKQQLPRNITIYSYGIKLGLNIII